MEKNDAEITFTRFPPKCSPTGMFCELCAVSVPNEASFQAHLRGQKHVRNVEKQNDWNKKARSSVYVGGIKKLPAAELSLADYFGKFGNVKKITIDKTMKCYAIVELEDEEVVNKILTEKQHKIDGVCVKVKPREVKAYVKPQPKQLEASIKEPVLSETLWKEIQDTKDVNSQILLLQEKSQLSPNDLHLRNLLCELVQSALQEAFPGCLIKQFGSSINGFGVHACDLDLHFEYEEVHPDILQELSPRDKEEMKSGTYSNDTTSAISASDVLLAVAEIIKQCIPDCHKIKAVLSARLPVVRFYHKSSDMRCDISLSNHLAVHNTKYLRFCWQLYPNFRPLVFVVRAWMKHWELAGGVHTNGPRLNNYAVTLLVLFYLQNTQQMPSLANMVKKHQGQKVLINGWDCTFPTSVSNFRRGLHSSSPIVELLANFFTFYAEVEFSNVVLDLRSAGIVQVSEFLTEKSFVVVKCNHPSNSNTQASVNGGPSSESKAQTFKIGSLNVRDPFELTHNVAANVNEKQMKLFTKCIRNAALASKMKLYRTKPQSSEAAWGLLNLFVNHHNKHTDASESDANSIEQRFNIKKPTNTANAGNWCDLAAGVVVVVFRDIFAMSINSVDMEDTAEQLQPSAVTYSREDCGEELQNCSSPCNKDFDRAGASESRKRPASPTDCGFCKRAKMLLSSPSSADISSSNILTISLPYTAECTATQRLWEGRRKARRNLVKSGKSDLLQLEIEVSKMLLSDKSMDTSVTRESINHSFSEDLMNTTVSSIGSADTTAVFAFTLRLELVDENTLGVTLIATSKNSDFITFYHHIKSFLPGFVIKCSKQCDI
ncbi:speckle targeted PIP5K1A-regulated poly(A) polymerase-like isoform X2 [Clavelina lepadiformis]|uniref:speckle targeted PIP5K1A-regulated poly(A) polymerase-like isoform X2 n=1 Tax=Clavelina lepadiformis TaxID=159417 RepID=UPI00404161B5